MAWYWYPLQAVLGQGGEENDAHLPVHFSDALGGAQAIHDTHLNVQKNQVDGGVVGVGEVRPVPKGADFQFCAGLLGVTVQQLGQMLDKRRFVITDCHVEQSAHPLSRANSALLYPLSPAGARASPSNRAAGTVYQNAPQESTSCFLFSTQCFSILDTIKCTVTGTVFTARSHRYEPDRRTDENIGGPSK